MKTRLTIRPRGLALLGAVIVMAGCAATPDGHDVGVRPAASNNQVEMETPEMFLADLDQRSQGATDVLDVSALPDANVVDWLQRARDAMKQGQRSETLAALEQGLLLAPTDPDLLQLQAQQFLLDKDFMAAEKTAHQSWKNSARLGDLCRRNWLTIAYARQAQARPKGSARAAEQATRCAVEPMPRM